MTHEDGKQHTFVVRLQVESRARSCNATGSYLGMGKDGKTGYILTAAHMFKAGNALTSDENVAAVEISFGPRLGDEVESKAGLRVLAQRLFICPQHEVKAIARPTLAKGVDAPMIPHADLAILAFDASACEEALENAKVQPAVLFEGKGQAELMDAKVVGFGAFGNADSTHTVTADRVHAGGTKVTLGGYLGFPAFVHWSPIKAGGPARFEEYRKDPRINLFPFLPQLQKALFLNPFDGQALVVQSHDNQVLAASGDSGGPLLLKNQSVLKVAGVSGHWETHQLRRLTDGCPVPSMMQVWQPVMPHLAWIRGIMAGEPGKSPVVDLWKADSGAVCKAEAKEVEAESKETKAES